MYATALIRRDDEVALYWGDLKHIQRFVYGDKNVISNIISIREFINRSLLNEYVNNIAKNFNISITQLK